MFSKGFFIKVVKSRDCVIELNKGLPVCINPLPNDKILNWFKLKAFADVNLKVIQRMINVVDSVENIVGKGENAGNQHFLLFPQCLQEPSCPKSLKVVIVW